MPTDSSTGSTIVEVANAGSYARQTLNPLNTNWNDPLTSGGTANTIAITFPQATADWGTPVAAAITDSATYASGNLLWYGALANPNLIRNGMTFTFSINALQVNIDN